ncbi:YfhO family protein [Fructilactobacillus hinvesii]|uniref:YfhO family protein n=1 Tax=Fructilactobacillus hinvesii TaxID=2940300 RepID=A0ABY5BTZ4_9LACO|nr:YfhO family protein [Fructilactobacillus hinvesii]USS88031.1 YfhO family protein [Fructilactobacillus hinvesii]
MLKLQRVFKDHLQEIIVIGFAFISLLMILPLLHGGIVYNQFDLQFHLTSVQESYLNLKNGNWNQIVPAISTRSFGSFGYPNNLFYPIFTFLPEALIHLIIPNPWLAYLLFMALVIFLIFISMYILGLKLKFPVFASALGALIYGFSGFVFLWSYNNEDLAQVIGLMFLPMVFWGLYQIILKKQNKWIWLSLGMFGIAMTHILSLLIVSFFVAFLLLFLLINPHQSWKEKGKRFLKFIYATITTILMGSFFLIPLAVNMHYNGDITVAILQLSKFTISLSNFFFSNIYAIHTQPNWTESSGIGITSLITLLVIAFNWKKLNFFFKYLTIGLGLFSLLCTNLFPWDLFQNLLKFIQFPIRFMMIVSFLIALIGAKSFANLELDSSSLLNQKNYQKLTISLFLFLGICSFYSGAEFLKHGGLNNLSQKQFKRVATKWNTLDYLPPQAVKIQPKLEDHATAKLNPGKKIKQKNYQTKPNELIYTINSSKSYSKIVIPTIYYPGFQTTVNNRVVKVRTNQNRAIVVPIQKGVNKITVKYQDPLIKVVAIWISIFTWIFILFKFIYNWKFER